MSKVKQKKYSYSMIDTYLTCGMKYKLQYLDGLTTENFQSHFVFGLGIDSASSVIFEAKLKDNPIPFDQTRMVEAFLKNMNEYKHLGAIVDVPTNPLARYSKGQVQLELLSQENADDIFAFADEIGISLSSIEEFAIKCQSIKSGLPENEQRLYNLICWHTFVVKGLMLLEELKKWSDGNIKEVISIQRKFEITNDEGSLFYGYMDIEAVMMDGSFRLLDLKTASNGVQQYPERCIDKAMQLHIYSQESSKLVGYIILEKQIRVREPRVRTRVILGEVTEEMLDETFEVIDNTIHEIGKGVFERNKDACFGYGKCTYYNLCWKNSKKGLVSKWKNSPKKEK
jgi:hypothetical protein